MNVLTCEIDSTNTLEHRFTDRNLETSATRLHSNTRQLGAALAALVIFTVLAATARASDHLDSPATVANP